jgi:uncharacterized protein (TIGR02246 family)
LPIPSHRKRFAREATAKKALRIGRRPANLRVRSGIHRLLRSTDPMRLRRHPLAAAAVLALAACTPAPRIAPSPESVSSAITAELNQSAQEWNRGNLEGFLLPYSDAAGTTFVGSTGLARGKQAIREKYVASYFHPGGTLPGTLSFRDIEVRPLGPDHALAVGRWIISDRASGQQASAGIFSLVFQRTPQGWRIIHDHSS